MQKNVLEYLDATAARWPDKPAFCDEGRSFTFGELREQARRCGTALIRRFHQVNRPIAVLTTRSALPVVGFMGALYSGNFYVPLDVSMPPARLELQLQKLSPLAVLFPEPAPQAEALIAGRWPALPLDELLLDEPAPALLDAARAQVLDIDPVYAIFTSGSTGVPKGILLSHRGVIDFADWYTDTMQITQEDVLGNQAPFFFDLSVKDLYTALKTGATCHILPKKCFSMPLLLTRALDEHKITTLSWATSAFHLAANSGVLQKHPPHFVGKISVGGEALGAKQLSLWRAALPHARILNLYGPTEVTVDCTWYEINRDFAPGEPVPIGSPCENKEVILLDGQLRPVPPGQVGEICVRGTGLALGYYNDPEKTAAAFIQNPLRPSCPDRLYRTGDLGFWGEDGLLYFSARKDGQIKHMGYRIELGEVETALLSLPGVKAAACFFDEKRDKLVCAYEGAADPKGLAVALRDKLPRYMLPNIYQQKDAMPYNANGKIDRPRLRKDYDESC